MHSCSEKTSAIFFPEKIQKSCHGALHGFFEELRRFERCIRFYFHDVQLEFFAESEILQLNEIYSSSVEVFYDFVHYGQRLQFLVNEGKLVLWTYDFEWLVRGGSSLLLGVILDACIVRG